MSRLQHTSSFIHTGAHLRLDGVSFSYPGHRVLTDVSFTVSAGQRVGLIGSNGSGKTTLLRLVAGRLTPSAGTIGLSAPGGQEVHIGLLHQEPPFAPSCSVAQALEAAVSPARRAARTLDAAAQALAEHPESPEAADGYSCALKVAEALGAWDADVRINATVSGLGLDTVDRARPAGSLSGGQRARLALAWLLLSAPDVLALDEPTNHLDDTAAAFLVRTLTSWRGPVLMASHDRAFLDETATVLVDLDPAPIPDAVAGPLLEDGTGTGIGVVRHTGSFSDYVAARAQARSRWQRRYQEEQAEIARLRAAVRDQHTVGHLEWSPRTEIRKAQRYYADRNSKAVSRRVSDARSRLEAKVAAQIRRPPEELRFRVPEGRLITPAGQPAGSAEPSVILSQRPTAPAERGIIPADASPVLLDRSPDAEPALVATQVGVAGRLAPTSLAVRRGERLLITGPNGSGKSTLLALLAGRLTPSVGLVRRADGDRIGLLAQDARLDDPRGRGPGRTAAQSYVDLVGQDRAREVPLASLGLLEARDLERPVATLSVGQQQRLALAVVLADPPEILLLDEPTNHLSLDLVTALEDAVATYPGTVVVASHDRWLRTRWPGRRHVMGTGASAMTGHRPATAPESGPSPSLPPHPRDRDI
ncbi:MAG: ABC-F family ATP-binding cassette domain-containing protein [Actinomyces sp.]|uniref:ABC-F family ATP-binding cassette domain-containing protein n=1 Tax=Actinomyces sp. TaxID=29317 RepID=UPI0026DCB7F3|nr:ABC-F family ATP-binding cassette domain-containing protein [Actinomyces sp.]MDO4242461.1 ABC-F family ATP-binding cassette domain-containing protein [Actinomyces sp.]